MAAHELYLTPLFSDANLMAYWRMEGSNADSKGTDNGNDTSVTYMLPMENLGREHYLMGHQVS